MKFKLNTKDLISIGIFTVIYFVVMFASGMIGLAGPAFIFVGAFISTILNGLVLVLLMARVPKMYSLTIVGLICGFGMVITGHYWLTIVGAIVLGFVADLIVSEVGRAQRLKPGRAIIAYAIFVLWTVFPTLPILFNSQAYFAEIADQMGQNYADQFQALVTPPILAGVFVVLFVLGLLGGWLGTVAHRKHFKRAGLTR